MKLPSPIRSMSWPSYEPTPTTNRLCKFRCAYNEGRFSCFDAADGFSRFCCCTCEGRDFNLVALGSMQSFDCSSLMTGSSR